MVTPQDIIEELVKQVGKLFPGEEVYTNRKSSDYARPSTAVLLRDYEVDPGMGPMLVGMAPVVELAAFAPVDAYGDSDTMELGRRQTALLGLFMPGFLRVKDRALHVEKLKLPCGLDYSSVVVTFRYAVDRQEFMSQDTAPVMEHIRFRDTHGVRYGADNEEDNEKE